MKNPFFIFVVAFVIAVSVHIYSQGGWEYIEYQIKYFSTDNMQVTGLPSPEEQLKKRSIQNRLLNFWRNKERNTPIKRKEHAERNVYRWTDSEGNIHASNVQYPEGNKTLKITKEIFPHENETPIQRKGNNIIIPVTLCNNRRKVTVNMIFDTGAHNTVIHEDVARYLKTSPYKNTKTKVADGRIVQTEMAKIDYISVGPNTMSNFTVYQIRQAQVSNEKGLLGMNFLQDHPFEIDLKRNVIKWL